MKLLAILGSPRRNGKISKMLDIAVVAARKAGYDVDFYNLYDMNIAFCKGCMNCRKSGICIINDDIKILRQKLIECDKVIIAAPTYFANVPAVVKNMFDRLAGTVMDDNNSSIPQPKLKSTQEYIIMTACNTPSPFDKIAGQSTGCIKAMNEFLHISGMKCRGKIVLAGTRNLKEIPNRIVKKIQNSF